MAERCNVERFYSPFGVPVQGTLESAPGTALADGTGADGFPEHLGETKIYWDGQTTIYRANRAVWVDEDGYEWLESELITDPTEAIEPAAYVSPWNNLANVKLFMSEQWTETSAHLLAGLPTQQATEAQLAGIQTALNTLASIALAIRLQNTPQVEKQVETA